MVSDRSSFILSKVAYMTVMNPDAPVLFVQDEWLITKFDCIWLNNYYVYGISNFHIYTIDKLILQDGPQFICSFTLYVSESLLDTGS